MTTQYTNALSINNTQEITQYTYTSINDAVTFWLTYLDVRPKTLETYSRNIRPFIKYLADNGIERPVRDDVIAFREYIDRDHQPATVQAYLMAVKQFFNFTEMTGLYPNIAKRISGKKISKDHKKGYLSAEQMRTVLNDIDRTTLKGKRDYAVLSLMVTAGLRTVEVIRADVKDLENGGACTVLYLQGKGHDEKDAYIKVTAQVETAINEYLQARGNIGPDAPLFASISNRDAGKRLTTRSVSRIVKSALLSAGFNSNRLTAHSLRHTTATLNLLNGATLEETQMLLRHTNINTTLIYSHALTRDNNNSEQRVTDAIFN